MKPTKVLVRLETLIALAAGALGIITAFWHDWIEMLTGWDPDRHNGSVEWLIVIVLLVAAAVMGLLARHHHRQLLVYDRDLADSGT